jgi:hypothetical protein
MSSLRNLSNYLRKNSIISIRTVVEILRGGNNSQLIYGGHQYFHIKSKNMTRKENFMFFIKRNFKIPTNC